MNLIKSVLPFLSLFSIDTGQETTIETRPALPDWQPIRGNMVPAQGQRVDRVIRRVRQDRNVTIYEEEVIFISEAPAPLPQSEPIREFSTYLGPPGVEPWELQVVADWHAGKAKWVGGNYHPDTVGIPVRVPSHRPPVPSHRPPTRIENGRIVLQE